jgi:hypothetical protein
MLRKSRRDIAEPKRANVLRLMELPPVCACSTLRLKQLPVAIMPNTESDEPKRPIDLTLMHELMST